MIVTPPYDPNTPYVLRGGFADGANVDHGQFWGHDNGTDLGAGCYWDAWVKPLSAAGGYLISDDYGGDHALLWGGMGAAQIATVFNGTTQIAVSGIYVGAVGEWMHVAVWWVGGYIRLFTNGVGDGQQVVLAQRQAHTDGRGHLYVFGSDHQNLHCDLAALRGYDRVTPVPVYSLHETAFRPQRVFGAEGNIPGVLADFLADYTAPTRGLIADHAPLGCVSSSATGAGPVKHPGRLSTTSNMGIALTGPYGNPFIDATYQLARPPYWVADPTCPYGRPVGVGPLPVENVPAPTGPPGGCLAHDSFGRRNQTPAFQTVPTLGSTEDGSLGPLPWQYTAAGRWGILDGAAVHLGQADKEIAWVNVGTASQDVYVTNARALGGLLATGLSFRVQDANNFWFAVVVQDPAYTAGVAYLNWGKVLAGTVTQLGNLVAVGVGWNELRVVANGTTITLYVDVTQVDQATGQTDLQSATGAGLSGAYPGYMVGSFARHRNWTVYAA